MAPFQGGNCSSAGYSGTGFQLTRCATRTPWAHHGCHWYLFSIFKFTRFCSCIAEVRKSASHCRHVVGAWDIFDFRYLYVAAKNGKSFVNARPELVASLMTILDWYLGRTIFKYTSIVMFVLV